MSDEPAPYHVLVIEGSSPLAAEVCGALTAADFQVTHVRSGGEALALSQWFSTAIVGMCLPDRSGREMVRELSEQGIPCIALAQTPTLENAIEIAGLAVHGLLVPPIARETLVALVTRVAGQRHLQAAVESERLHTAQLMGILQTIDTIQDRINNPLQSLIGYSELLEEAAVDDAEQVRVFAGRVREAGRRVADVVDKLRRVRRPATRKWSFGETLDLDAAAAPAQERRAHARTISVMLARIAGGTERRWYFVEDLSQGGCALSSLSEIVLPNDVEVELADPESGETYWCHAQRIWHDETQSYAGLRFTTIDPRLLDRLKPKQA